MDACHLTAWSYPTTPFTERRRSVATHRVAGFGTIFSLELPPGNISPTEPRLQIIPFASSVILAWPTNPPGFFLQSCTNLAPPIAWTNVSPAPVIVYGSNTVLSPISGSQQLFRLSQ